MERRDINIVLGVGMDGELYILDGIFHNSNNFQGVTAYSMRYLSDEDIAERNDFDNVMDYCDELWRMAVEDGRTQDGLREWTEQYINDCYGNLYPGWDSSFYTDTQDAIGKLSRNAQVELYKYYDQDDIGDEFTCECGGGGRHLPEDNEWQLKFVSDELLDLLHRLDNTKEDVDWDRLNALIDIYDREDE